MRATRQDLRRAQTMNSGYIREYFTMEEAGANIEIILERDRALLNSILDRYETCWIVYRDSYEKEEALQRRAAAWVRKFRARYEETKDRYHAILNAYESSRDNLLAKLGSTTSVRFNDTPQNSGDFSGESYASTYTETKTEADAQDLIDRLAKIQSQYMDVLRAWADEFRSFFGEETV